MATTEANAMLRGGAVLVGLSMGLSLGCLTVRPDPDHCANLEGNQTCEDRYPGERTYCTACGSTHSQDGCVTERPAEDVCYSPCGGQSRFEDDATCLADSSSSSGEASTSTGEETGTESGSSESSTTGPMPCVDNEDCPGAAAPFCEPVSGECVACDAFGAEADAACAGLDPMAPLCVNGACVACTPENPTLCDEQLLLCDAGTNSCIPCTEHDQCGSGACELAVGRCFPEDFVVHVDADGGQDYLTVVLAVADVDDGTHGVIVVHDRDDGLGYQGVTIDGGKIIALLGAPGEDPILQGTGGNPGLRVEGVGTIAYADRLGFVGNTMGLGLRVDGAFAWVDRSRIVQNTGGGIVAQNAAELVLRNCFVGDGTNGVNGITVDGATIDVLYSSLGAGVDNFDDVFPLFCSGTVDVSIRNSLLVSFDNPVELSCGGATVTNTASEALIPGAGNVALGNVGPTWFVGIDTGDFHVDSPPAMLATTARWQTGDPLTDIDGAPRPTVDGTAEFAGADVP